MIIFFLLGNDKFYENIKNEIINWIEEHMETFKEFFGDDDINNISKEKLTEDEYNYIKKKDSWGGFHTIEIACIIFNISIGIYTDNGKNEYIRYSFSENINNNADLMLLEYHNNNNHFNILYDKNINLNYEEKGIKNLNLNISKNAASEDIKYQGKVFSNKYVLTKYKGDENLYDEISNFLKSVQKHEIEITIQKKNHPKWHINQISLFDLNYPARMAKKSDINSQQRRIFRKEVSK